VNLEPDSPRPPDDEGLTKRVDALVAWIDEIDARLRTTEVATGDEKTAKELRKAVEAAAKHDPKLEERVKNRVDVLGDRLETLASTVGTTSAALAAKDGELVAVRKELAVSVARMEALATDVRQTSRDRDVELRKAVDKLASDHAKRKRSERDPEVDRKLAYLSERLDTLSTTVNESAAATARREGELATLRRETEAADSSIAAALSEIRGAVDQASLLELRKQVDAFGARERELATLRAKSQERDARVTAAIKELREALTGVAKHVSALRKQVDSAELTALTERVAGLEASPVTDLGARLENIETAAVGMGSRVADLESATSGKLAALVHASNEIRAELGGTLGRLEALERAANEPRADDARLGELEAALESVRQQAAAHASELACVESAFEEIRKDTATRDAELAAALQGALDAGLARVESATSEQLDGLAAGGTELRAEIAATLRRLDAVEATASAPPDDSRLVALEAALDGVRDEATARGDALAAATSEHLQRVTADVRTGIAGALTRLTVLEADAAARAEEPDRHAELESALEALRQEAETRRGEVADLQALLDSTLARAEEATSEQLAEIARKHDEARSELADTRGRLEALEASASEPAEEDPRLAAFEAALDAVRHDAGSRDEQLAVLQERLDSGLGRVDQLVADLLEALRTMPSDVGADTSELVEAWEAERAWVRTQLGALAAMQAASAAAPSEPHDVASALAELATRVALMEASVRGSHESGLAQLEWRLQQLEGQQVHAHSQARVVPIRTSEA
jgi:chromosome segregation ATPase